MSKKFYSALAALSLNLTVVFAAAKVPSYPAALQAVAAASAEQEPAKRLSALESAWQMILVALAEAQKEVELCDLMEQKVLSLDANITEAGRILSKEEVIARYRARKAAAETIKSDLVTQQQIVSQEYANAKAKVASSKETARSGGPIKLTITSAALVDCEYMGVVDRLDLWYATVDLQVGIEGDPNRRGTINLYCSGKAANGLGASMLAGGESVSFRANQNVVSKRVRIRATSENITVKIVAQVSDPTAKAECEIPLNNRK